MKSELRIIGGTREFEAFIKKSLGEDVAVVRFASPEDAVNAKSLECLAYILLPFYEQGQRFIPEMDFETLKKFAGLLAKGQKLFIENYNSGNYSHGVVFGHMAYAKERHFFNEYLLAGDDLKAELPDGHVLQARASFYYPGRAMGYHTDYGDKILLSVSDCIGTHNVFVEGSFNFPVLMRLNNFFCSAMNMTEYDRLTMLPVFRWKEVYAFLFHEILGVQKKRVADAFEKAFRPISFYGTGNNTLENSVERAVKWHFNAGLLLDETGSKGMFEMIRSNDLSVRANIRMDSELITGLLFCLEGKRKNDDKLIQTGKNLIRFLLDNGIQIDKGAAEGLFKWFYDLNIGPRWIWSTDAGRGGLVMINMYKLFKDKEYLERAQRLGNGLLRWLGKEGLLNGMFDVRIGFAQYQSAENVTDNPVYYGEITSFLLQLYKHTGDEKYKDAVLKFTERIMSKFPDVQPFGYSDNFTYSRYLLMISAIQEILDVDLSDKINACLLFFQKLQHQSGGIRETPIRGLGRGSGEAGVGIGDNSDKIADMLYCNNFVLCGLSIISKMHNPRSVNLNLARDMYARLRDFLLGIQIDDSDPRLNGGWMRAFDMDHAEYYGLNKDIDWGAYCIMAGWITGFIPLVFLNEMGEQSAFI